MEIEELITLSEAAQRLGLSVQTLRSWVAAGDLPAYRRGKRFTRVSWHAVLAALAPGSARCAERAPELGEGAADAR